LSVCYLSTQRNVFCISQMCEFVVATEPWERCIR